MNLKKRMHPSHYIYDPDHKGWDIYGGMFWAVVFVLVMYWIFS